jgi:hypothetical protein
VVWIVPPLSSVRPREVSAVDPIVYAAALAVSKVMLFAAPAAEKMIVVLPPPAPLKSAVAPETGTAPVVLFQFVASFQVALVPPVHVSVCAERETIDKAVKIVITNTEVNRLLKDTSFLSYFCAENI